jgi:CubicO group peptidase (beta-lactamase class C family)
MLISIPIRLLTFLLLTLQLSACSLKYQNTPPSAVNLQGLDETVLAAMKHTGARGLAVAVVDRGQVVFNKAYGVRDAANVPLNVDTVMYGASLTKSAFAYLVMQLVDEGKLELDRPIADYLPKALPAYDSAADARDYVPWAGLAADERWRLITSRHLLSHSAGFNNFAFIEPDGKLRIHFTPGSHYAYSGAGILLLQFVLERGLGIDVGAEMQARLFDPNNMRRTSLKWRADFRPNLADGFTIDGKVEPHSERRRVRTAGSMDTTINDMAQLAASVIRGDRLSAAAYSAWLKPQLPIYTPSQFPSLQNPPAEQVFPGLSTALGVLVFNGPQGAGFFKGGHNDSTGNTWVCLLANKRCVVILANDVRAEAAFPAIVQSVLGEAGVPWAWEYAGLKLWDGLR